MQTRNLSISQGWSQVDLSEGTDVRDALGRYVEEMDTRFRDLVNWIESFTVPEYTTVQRDALDDPQNGQMIYNSTTTRFEIRQAGGWKYLTVSSV
jgi:hypothetical protein